MECEKMNLKTFEIITQIIGGGRLTFLTKAKNGKDALLQLTTHSGDFKNILNKNESNNITITITHMKPKVKK